MMTLIVGPGLAPESRAKWEVCCSKPVPELSRVTGGNVRRSYLECENCGAIWGQIQWGVDIATGVAR